MNTFATAMELADAYRQGTAKPTAVVEAALDRIAAHEDKLGAFQTVYAKDARKAAQSAELAIASGHRIGPFHGVPFVLKDIVDFEGRITTGGSMALKDRVSPATAIIGQRLLSAGGVLIGKTKTVEFAMGGWGTNQRMGTPWNPWDLETPRTPGGSSSGSGVAVAAGYVPCAVGTDTGGSVRLPAAWCGITGLKVTEGRLPTDGILPLSHTLDTPGPMVRSVADAVLMFSVMDGMAPTEMERQLRDGSGLFAALRHPIAGLRLGVMDEEERGYVEADLLQLYDAAVDRLRGLGAEIVPFTSPMSFDSMKDTVGVIIAAEAHTHHGLLIDDPDTPLDEDVRPRIAPGKNILARDYVAMMLKRKQDQLSFLASMRGLDALLTPTTQWAAIPNASVDQTGTPAHFTRPANYLAMCALSLPMGLTPDGLPGSLQIMARGGDEYSAVRIGAAFEALGGIGHPPL